MERNEPFTWLKHQLSLLTLNKRTAQIASAIAILVGCLVLLSWSWDISFLKSVIPQATTMKANTAIGFILAGISLGLQTRRRKSTLTTTLAQGCAIAVITLGLLNLFQYLFNCNLGIDELLFQDFPISPETAYPGRMEDNTALNFTLTGLALWLNGQKLNKERKRRSYYVAQNATLIAAVISLLALVGYAYNVEIFYRFIFYSSSMAIHTALTFLLLCIGILSLQKNHGWMQIVTSNSLGGIVARRLIPAAIAVPLVLGWLIRQGQLAGWYDPNFGLSLMVMSLIVILLRLIGRSADMINKIDGDRKRSEDRLRSSEERLQLALTGANQGIWDWNLKTEVLIWDDRCKEIFGLPPDFPVSYKWHLDSLHPDDRERVFEAGVITLRDRIEFHEEYRTFHPDGTMHWIMARGRGYYDATGEPERMSGIVLDISDRKQAQLNEQFLNQLDLRLRQLSDAKAMTWETVSSLGEYLNVDRCLWHEIDWENRLAIVARNWQREDVSDLAGTYNLDDFFTSEQFDRLAAGQTIIVPDVTTHPEAAPYAENYLPLSVAAFVVIPCIQSGRWVANLAINCTTVRNWRDDEVKLLQETVGRLWSIVEQTRALQALRESEYQYRTLFETIDQGFCVCQMLFDENGEPCDYRFLEVNPVFEQMTGLQPVSYTHLTLPTNGW
jgi:PAS domain S-box-containing protein